jgi:hypothetical protein
MICELVIGSMLFVESKCAEIKIIPAPTPKSISRTIVQPKNDIQKYAHDLVLDTFGDQWDSFNSIVNSESGWNQYALNKSSGACGLFQALPCSKTGCSLDDYKCQVNWGIEYIKDRYGDPNGAWQFWKERHWY